MENKPKICSGDCLKDLNNLEGHSVLLGNGILMANPGIKNSLPEDFFERCYENVSNLFQKGGVYGAYLSGLKCPEEFLDIHRIELSFEVLLSYYDLFRKIREGKNEYLKGVPKFLMDFSNIFTINYDPITYHAMIVANEKREVFSMLTESEKGGEEFRDGMYPCRGKSKEQIRNSISQTGKGLYFLHGAFHILHKSNVKKPFDAYMKISSKKDDCTSRLILEMIREDFRLGVLENLPRLPYDLTTVLESRSQNKLAWIQNDPYLRFCLEQLKKQRKVLVLGCSFSKDDHILEALLLSQQVESLEIGVFSCADLENIYAVIRRLKRKEYVCMDVNLKKSYEKISFICTQKLGELVWGEKAPEQCKKVDLSKLPFDGI